MKSEAEIVVGLKNTEEWAVDAVIFLYGDRLFRSAVAITGDWQLAEEVVQDTFIQMSRKIHSFKQRSSLQTWMFSITINIAKNRIRSTWIRKVSTWGDSEEGYLSGDSNDSTPETEFIKKEQHNEIIHCLRELPQKYHAVMALYYLEDFTIKQISEILKEPEGTIKSKLSRGRNMLKDGLQVKGVVAGDISR